MTGHIQDLWFVRGRDGRLHPTARNGHGLRWKARYTDPDQKERSKSFARKADAERFLTEIGHSMIAGSYLDPDAGRITLRSRVPAWLETLTCDATSKHHAGLRMTRHLLPKLGDKRLDVLAKSPSLIQAWVAGLPVGASYAQQMLGDLSAIMDAAVADGLIPRNPCRSETVKAPRVVRRQLVPWTREQVEAVRAGLPERYRAMADVGAGLGLRQGEIIGLALSEVDWLRKNVHVRQQVRRHLGVVPVFAAPKGGKPRQVPLPQHVALELAAHLEKFPAKRLTLPWETPDGKPHTEDLIFTPARAAGPVAKNTFNVKAWTPARRAAGIADSRDAGMHQLRHYYASTLLRGGVDIKRVQSWLGHHSAAFTIDVYGHLVANDHEASLRQVEAIFAAQQDSGLKVEQDLKSL